MRRHFVSVLLLVPFAVLALSIPAARSQARQPAQEAKQALRLPKIIGSHMVLQRDTELPIWGWAAPGDKVAVRFAGSEAAATADGAGKWMVRLPAMKAGGPHKLTVTGGKSGKIELEDILIGEVWLCSGQSNMAWRVGRADNSKAEIAAANHPRIRLFDVQKVQKPKVADDVGGRWQVCTPKSVEPFSAVAYFFGLKIQEALGVPVGLINASVGGSPIQPWTAAKGYELVEEFAEGKLDKPPQGGMYNGMIAPIVPLPIRGALWYQGESNVKEGWAYNARMKALIAGWRAAWGRGDFPFYFVQLAPYAYYPVGMLPPFWEAQTATLTVPNTGMAVITDLVTNLKDIHPPAKRPVGERLALWALAGAYGRKGVVFSGPMYKSMTVKGGKIIIEFDHVGGGLASRDGKELTHFQIAGADKKFFPAKAVIVGGTVEVSSEKVTQPAAVRFAWENTAQPNLVNKEHLPACPFRTDRW